MTYTNVFHFVKAEFDKVGIPCFVVGGFAVNLYGLPRLTLDADFAIAKFSERKAVGILESGGYTCFQRTDQFARFRNSNFRLMDMDLMFLDEETFEQMRVDARKTAIAGKDFFVPSLKNLIAMKLHALKNNRYREVKDFPDVISLLTINKISEDTPWLEDILMRFGNKDLYDRIKALIKKD